MQQTISKHSNERITLLVGANMDLGQENREVDVYKRQSYNYDRPGLTEFIISVINSPTVMMLYHHTSHFSVYDV